MRKRVVADSLGKDEQIFVQAVRIFKLKGYHATSMQDIADAVGLKKGSLYHYIESKEQLLYRIFEQSTGALTRRLQEILASDAPPVDKLRDAIEAHVTALCDHLDLYTVYLSERRTLTGRTQAQVRAEAERHARLLEQIIQAGIAQGVFRPVDSKMSALAILGMCNWLYQWYSPGGRLAPASIARLFADLAVNGLVDSEGPL